MYLHCISMFVKSVFISPEVHPIFAANANRQRQVNCIAKCLGAGTGTARYYGVPGVDPPVRQIDDDDE